jgi:hypothetical protein
MLPDRYCRLLTAYVDGELNVRQQKQARRLLQRSHEARRLYADLQSDSRRLKALPRPTLPADFGDRVMEKVVAAEPPPIIVRRPTTAPKPLPLAFRVGIAAGILLAFGTAGYVFWAAPAYPPAVNPDLAKARSWPEPRKWVSRPFIPPEYNEPLAEERAKLPEQSPRIEPEKAPPATVVAKEKGPPEPTPAEEAILAASPSPKMEVFQEVGDPRLAVVLRLSELDLDKSRRRLQEELSKGGAFRVEVNCLETARTFEKLRTALGQQGIRLLIDQDAQRRLNNRLARTHYVLYTENVTPVELARALEQLTPDAKKGEVKRKADGPFEHVVVNAMTAADHKELSQFLGVNPTQLQPGKPKSPLDVNLRKPLAEKTADQVVKSLKGEGTPRPQPGKPVVAGPERLAIVLAYNPVRPRPNLSAEVKRFLEGRKELRQGTLQTLLVLRTPGG